jgi:arabinan endo-1,5-alpha-L-arabinosidase
MQYTIPLWILLLFTVTNASAQQPDQPMKGDIGVHDPVMIRQDSTYYIFHTGKGVPFKTSRDRINWKNTGRVFDTLHLPGWHKKDIPEQDGSLWAPDIHYHNGRYHLYYSVSAWMNFNSGIGYATNTTLNPADPNYRWTDQGMVIDYKQGGTGVNVIDPNVFIDDDGSKWLVYGSYKAGLRMTELDAVTGKLKKEQPHLVTLTTSLGEGVYIIKDKDYYYIFASRGRCCAGLESTYQVVMGRSTKLQGPYLNKAGQSWQENHYTVLLSGDNNEPGRGHNGFFTEGDTTFIVYHAYTRAANGKSLLNIKKLYVDRDGWPTVEQTGTLFQRKDRLGKSQ